MDEITKYAPPDSEINLPISPRICPSSLNGSYLGTSGGSGVGVIYCANGSCLNCLTDYTFHARNYHDFNQPFIKDFPPLVSSVMSLPDGLTSCNLGKEALPMFVN